MKNDRYSTSNKARLLTLNGGDSETVVDISGYPTGMYLIILCRDDGIKTVKYSLIK